MKGCVEFVGCKDREGYGKLRFDKKYYRAHRFVWEQLKGPIPHGYFVCHKCDNPSCILIDHLFLGTNRDNVRDMYKKNRQWKGFSKLSKELVKRRNRNALGRFT